MKRTCSKIDLDECRKIKTNSEQTAYKKRGTKPGRMTDFMNARLSLLGVNRQWRDWQRRSETAQKQKSGEFTLYQDDDALPLASERKFWADDCALAVTKAGLNNSTLTIADRSRMNRQQSEHHERECHQEVDYDSLHFWPPSHLPIFWESSFFRGNQTFS